MAARLSISAVLVLATLATPAVALDHVQLQAMLHAGGTVRIPAGDHVIGSPLYVTKPTLIVGEGTGATRIIASPGTYWADHGLFEVHGDNVTIRDLTVHGNGGANPTGQAYGVAIRGANRVTLDGVEILDVPGSSPAGTYGGDGVLIDFNYRTHKHPYNITVRNSYIAYCARQGISITAGRWIRIEGNTIASISGWDPGAAIDIEPNQPTHVVTDVTIHNNFLVMSNYGFLVVNAVGAAIERIVLDAGVIRGSRTADVRTWGATGVTVKDPDPTWVWWSPVQ